MSGSLASVDRSPRGRWLQVLQSEVPPGGFRNVAPPSMLFVGSSVGYGIFGQACGSGSQNNVDKLNLKVNSYYE